MLALSWERFTQNAEGAIVLRNLTPYPSDPFEVFQQIVQSKRRNRRIRLEAIRENIRHDYDYYWNNRNNLASIAPQAYQGAIKDDLLTCYEVSTHALGAMKAAIHHLQHTLGGVSARCQYCIINTGSTMDHYLPKETYPEFAVYALNLVPCCSECNSFKSKTFLVDGQRQFVNLYFDSLPTNSRFLHVKLAFKDDILPIPTYHIEQAPGVSVELTTIINKHFQQLQLNRRYRDYTSEIVSEIIASISNNNLAQNTITVSQLLHEEASKDRVSFGLNYWRAAFIDVLADSDHFLTKTIPTAIANPGMNLHT